MEKLMQLPKVEGAEGDSAAAAAGAGDKNKGERRKSGLMSLLSKKEKAPEAAAPAAAAAEAVEEEEEEAAEHKARRGMDLATTLERIQKNFVITDPRLPENPIVSRGAGVKGPLIGPLGELLNTEAVSPECWP